MELDADGWPQLPDVGTYIEFRGMIVLQAMGVCVVEATSHVRNAAGKPGGRVDIRTEHGHVVSVTLSDIRKYAREVDRAHARTTLERIGDGE